MSKNPAWNAYNEAVRKANETYDAEIRPLRVELSENIKSVEDRIDPKIRALQLEKNTMTKNLQDDYSAQVMAHEKTRRDEVARAHKVLKAELDAAKTEKVAA